MARAKKSAQEQEIIEEAVVGEPAPIDDSPKNGDKLEIVVPDIPDPRDPATLILETLVNSDEEGYDTLIEALSAIWEGVHSLDSNAEAAAAAKAEVAGLLQCELSDVLKVSKETLANTLALRFVPEDLQTKLRSIVAAEDSMAALAEAVKSPLLKAGYGPISNFSLRIADDGTITFSGSKTSKARTSGGTSKYVPVQLASIDVKNLKVKLDGEMYTIWEKGQSLHGIQVQVGDDTVSVDTDLVKGGLGDGTTITSASSLAKLAGSFYLSLRANAAARTEDGVQYAAQFWHGTSDGVPHWLGGNAESKTLWAQYKSNKTGFSAYFEAELESFELKD